MPKASFGFSVAAGNGFDPGIAPVLTGDVAASSVLPQFAFGGGWYSALYFNTTNGAINLPVNFISDGGTPLTVPAVGGSSTMVNLAAYGTALNFNEPFSFSVKIAFIPAGGACRRRCVVRTQFLHCPTVQDTGRLAVPRQRIIRNFRITRPCWNRVRRALFPRCPNMILRIDGNAGFDPIGQHWGKVERLSSNPLPDTSPQLWSDVTGRTVVVWQGFRQRAGGRPSSSIFVRQLGDSGWGPEVRVTDHDGNDWAPSVALDSSGAVWVIYDSYRNGNYDVFMTRVHGGRVEREITVAATPRFEARPPWQFAILL